MRTIFALSGSLRAASSNSALVRFFRDSAPESCSVDVFQGLAELPHFNPDHDVSEYACVVDLITRVRQSTAFVVSTPEYAHGLPGSLKNALDWLVGTDAFIQKRFAILTTSTRSVFARTQLVEVLNTMDGIHIDTADVTIELMGKDLSLSLAASNTGVRDICASSALILLDNQEH